MHIERDVGRRTGITAARDDPPWKRRLLVAGGTVSLALGIVGIALPILPTTPFLLLSAACYARGSKRFYDWLMGNRVFGTYIRNYQEGRGLPWKIKAMTIILLWSTIGLTVVIFVQELWLRLLLLVVAAAVTVHVASIGPREL